MIGSVVTPGDSLARENIKLRRMVEVLMQRVEEATDASGVAYAQFQRAALLEEQVRNRTRDLESTLGLLNATNRDLEAATLAADAARANLTDAIEAVPEGFALFDRDDRLVLCNSRFARLFPDLSGMLVPGMPLESYIAQASRSPVLKLPAGTRPSDWSEYRLARHREGQASFNVELAGDRWLQVSGRRTSDGGTVIIQTEITAIIRAERFERSRLLDDQARMIRATLEHIDQGVGIFDAEARLAGWNRHLGLLLGLPNAGLQPGAELTDLLDGFPGAPRFGDPGTAQMLAEWLACMPPRPPLTFDLIRPGEMTLQASARDMPGEGFVLSLRDVTEERHAARVMTAAKESLEARMAARTLELEDALARAERASAARTRFVAAASHDLQQPLSAARLFVAAAADDPALGEATRQSLYKAQNALGSVGQILEALLDISRLESGRAPVTIARVDLAALLRQLADEFAPVADAKGLRLTIRPLQAQVASDPTYLRRILQNLIGNALRYTERGRVLLGVRRRGETVQIEIWDSGPGIPESEQKNVFKEFHRLNARASAAEGMGLGLAIVERASALLGHRLALRSLPGRGSRFTLGLDLAPPPRAGKGARRTLGRPATAGGFPVAPSEATMMPEHLAYAARLAEDARPHRTAEEAIDLPRGTGDDAGAAGRAAQDVVPGRDAQDIVPDRDAQDIVPGRGAPPPSVPAATDGAEALAAEQDMPDATGLLVLVIDADAEAREALTTRIEDWGMATIDAAGGEAALALLAEIGVLPDAILAAAASGAEAGALGAIARLRRRHGPIPARVLAAEPGRGMRRACAAQTVGLMPAPPAPEALRAYLDALSRQRRAAAARRRAGEDSAHEEGVRAARPD